MAAYYAFVEKCWPNNTTYCIVPHFLSFGKKAYHTDSQAEFDAYLSTLASQGARIIKDRLPRGVRPCRISVDNRDEAFGVPIEITATPLGDLERSVE